MGESANIIDLEDGWFMLHRRIVKLINQLASAASQHYEPSTRDYMYIYSTVYKMCNQEPPNEYSQQIYDKYCQSLKEYIISKVLPALRKELTDEFLVLRELVKWWEHYKAIIRYLSNMLYYVDDIFVQENELPSLAKVGFTCFRDQLVYYDMLSNIKDAAIKLINRERDGEKIDLPLLKSILHFFLQIGIDSMDFYKNNFEVHILEDTETYYSGKAALWILQYSPAEYLVKAEDCLKHEKNRVASHYLHSSAEQKLLEKVSNELLARYETQLLEDSRCHAWLNAGNKTDLSRMYRLFSTIPKGLEQIAKIFSQNITSKGTALLIKWADALKHEVIDMRDTLPGIQEHSFVHQVMEFHDTYMDFVEHVFGNNKLFLIALGNVFDVIWNEKVAGITCAELLAAFCNTLLKSGASGNMLDDQMDSELEKALNLVRYLDDTRLFSEFCRKTLANRLLFNKDANESQERRFLSKLKLHCDVVDTSKMEVMLNDFALSRETQATFLDISKKNLRIDFSVTVLNTIRWPTWERSELNLPSEMVNCVEVFKQFYSTQHKRRKLTWIYSMGTCDIISKFDLKIIEITATTHQAVTLLLFNDSQTLTYEDIKFELNLPDEDVEPLLQSIACTDFKILLKQPSNKTISPSDSFEFNRGFTHKLNRIKLPLPKKKVTETLKKDRARAIEAAIVRIMKRRRALHVQELYIECIEQLQRIFKPKIKEIENGVEELISRDFLEKDEKNPDLYIYVDLPTDPIQTNLMRNKTQMSATTDS